jgi:hypothetical protein
MGLMAVLTNKSSLTYAVHEWFTENSMIIEYDRILTADTAANTMRLRMA